MNVALKTTQKGFILTAFLSKHFFKSLHFLTHELKDASDIIFFFFLYYRWNIKNQRENKKKYVIFSRFD